MTTLAANVNADVERWTLDSLPSTQYVQVDDETIEVRAMFPSSTYSLTGETLPPRIRVRRGIAGTTKASHLSGATLTPNYGLGSGEGGGAIAVTGTEGGEVAAATALILPGTVTEPVAGQAELATLAAGVQRLRLLVLSVAHDTAALGNPGVVFTDEVLIEGTVVISAWIIETTEWVVPDNNARLLKIGLVLGAFEDNSTIRQYDYALGTQGAAGAGDLIAQQPADDASSNNRPYTHVWNGPVNPFVRVTGTLPTSGAVNAYLLIAEPA